MVPMSTETTEAPQYQNPVLRDPTNESMRLRPKSTTNKMQHHEFATLFPMLPDAELQTLADDIAANGLQTPITTLDGMILDGRNRHRACEIAGVDPIFEEYLGGDPLAFVLSHNLHRRHLNEPQRAMIASKIANIKFGDNQHKEGVGIPIPKAGAMLNVSRDSVTQAKKIIAEGIPELADMVQQGAVSLASAVDVAKLPEAQQKQAVAGGAEGVKAAAKKSRESKQSTAKHSGLSLEDSPPHHSGKTPKYIPNDAEELWIQAKMRLDNILPSDPSRESVLKEVIEYCNSRISDRRVHRSL